MKKNTTTLLLVIAILLFANLVSEQYFLRIDLTEDKQYTLSEASRNILKTLEEPVTVKAYFSENLPPQFSKSQKNLEDFLIEYNRLSDNNIIYEFINPNEDEKKEMEAMQAGVQPVMINVREKNQMQQQKAFMGAVLELGEMREVIPFISPEAPLEYALSTAIKKMTITNKPYIGFVQGHGEPDLSNLSQVAANLRVLYNVEAYHLNDSTQVPSKFQTLAIIRPMDSISEGQLKQLDAFLDRGGKLLIALNRVEGNLQTANGSVVNTGLESWLAKKGITVDNQFIVDAQCGTITVQQQRGFFRFASQLEFPYMPVISNFKKHPVTEGLEAVVMQFASPLKFTGDSSLVSFTPLALTSKKSGSIKAPLYFNIQKQWTERDFPLQHQVVAGVLENKTEGDNSWRLMVVGDGDFPVGGARGEQVNVDNINFMVNAVDWLSDNTGLIDLRTKGIIYRPIDELEDATKTLLKWLNFLLPILLLIIYGLLRMHQNRIKRIKRMEVSYE